MDQQCQIPSDVGRPTIASVELLLQLELSSQISREKKFHEVTKSQSRLSYEISIFTAIPLFGAFIKISQEKSMLAPLSTMLQHTPHRAATKQETPGGKTLGYTRGSILLSDRGILPVYRYAAASLQSTYIS